MKSTVILMSYSSSRLAVQIFQMRFPPSRGVQGRYVWDQSEIGIILLVSVRLAVIPALWKICISTLVILSIGGE